MHNIRKKASLCDTSQANQKEEPALMPFPPSKNGSGPPKLSERKERPR